MKTFPKAALLLAQGLCGALLLVSGAAAANPPSSAAPPPAAEPGLWQKHQYSFNFMGFTTTYSCDGLEDKLKLLLLAAGARKDVKTSAGGCSAPFGRPDKFARAELTFYTLAPGNEAAPAVPPAPVRGKPPAPPEPVSYGRGSWKTVEFTAHSPRELGVGDCELVEQFRDHVLPLFATRDVLDHTTCIPHQNSGSEIELKFQSFAAAPGGPEVLPSAMPAAAGPAAAGL